MSPEQLPNYTPPSRTRWELVPGYMISGVRLYVEQGVMTGHFLTSVMENDLVHSFSTADNVNASHMSDWAEFLYSSLPTECWGNPEKVKKWKAAGGLRGLGWRPPGEAPPVTDFDALADQIGRSGST